MKKIAFAVSILILLLKLAVNSFVFKWDRHSEDIEFSQKNKLFLGGYELVLEENFTDLRDAVLINWISSIDVWAEYAWHREPFLVFFHPIQLEGDVNLVMKNKVGWKNQKVDINAINVRIAGYNYGAARKNDTYSVLTLKDNDLKASYDVVFYKNNVKEFFTASLIREN